MTGDVDRAGRIAFRPLASADFPSIQRWLTEPGVAAWWREPDLGLEAIARKYTPLVDGSDPARGFVIVIEGDPAGFIQAYRIGDHPEYQRQLGIDRDAVATDLFIGEATLRGSGWGTAVVQAFLAQVVFGEFGANLAMIAPEPANTRAIHVRASRVSLAEDRDG